GGLGALRLPGLRSAAATRQRVATRHASPAPWHGRGAMRFAYPGYAVRRRLRSAWRRVRPRQRPGTAGARCASFTRATQPAANLQRVATRHASPAPWYGGGAVRFAYPGYAAGGKPAARGDASGLASALARQGRGPLRLPGLRT